MSDNSASVPPTPTYSASPLYPDLAPAAQTDEARIATLRTEVEGLREAMRSRASIEQAKGMVMLCYGLAPDEAFAQLVSWSSRFNVKLRVVAETLEDMTQRVTFADAGALLGHEVTSALRSLDS